MKSLNSPFDPVIKPSHLLKARLNSQKLKKKYVALNTLFTFYVLSSTEDPRFDILNNDLPIKYKSLQVQNTSKFRDRVVYSVTFICASPGDYFVFSREKPAASDFIVNVGNVIDRARSEIVFDKFNNTIVVHLYSIEGKQFYLKNHGVIYNGNEFNIGNQKIFVKLTDQNNPNYDLTTKVINM